MVNDKWSMKTGFISVPFKASSPNGFKEYNGIAKFSPAGIIFEFETKILGFIGNEVKEIRVSLDEILDIKFRKGFYKFFANIQIRLKSFAKMSQLPNESGKIKMKIKREDFDLAQEAVEEIQNFINGNPTLNLQESEDHERLPPPTSVNELFDTEKLEDKNSKTTNKLTD